MKMTLPSEKILPFMLYKAHCLDVKLEENKEETLSMLRKYHDKLDEFERLPYFIQVLLFIFKPTHPSKHGGGIASRYTHIGIHSDRLLEERRNVYHLIDAVRQTDEVELTDKDIEYFQINLKNTEE